MFFKACKRRVKGPAKARFARQLFTLEVRISHPAAGSRRPNSVEMADLLRPAMDGPMWSSPLDHYRPDIDGLRAIAVMLVVAFHAFPEAIPGGFIGVDIFFVISGFLITGIVVRELDQQRFSLVAFYSRRIKRIFPALI